MKDHESYIVYTTYAAAERNLKKMYITVMVSYVLIILSSPMQIHIFHILYFQRKYTIMQVFSDPIHDLAGIDHINYVMKTKYLMCDAWTDTDRWKDRWTDTEELPKP